MTPKEKAQELVEKFRGITIDDINYYQCIPCALIAVDEILLIANDYFFHDKDEIKTKAYWQEVKKEIEYL